jgi:hypothetical protein
MLWLYALTVLGGVSFIFQQAVNSNLRVGENAEELTFRECMAWCF